MMSRIHLRFYEELNDFLPAEKRKCLFPYTFEGDIPVETLLRDLHVPPELVELVLVNGNSVGFSFLLSNGDRVSVYPVFESLDVGSIVRVRKKPLRQIRFLVDPELRCMAAYLRLFVFDTLVSDSTTGEEMILKTEENRRLLLTRDAALLQNPSTTRIHLVQQNKPRHQLAEILSRYDLYGEVAPFSRCPSCNKTVHNCLDWSCAECGRKNRNNLRSQRIQFLTKQILKREATPK
ncbi:MAG: Mut7-C RNAse domain-containing protein [Acidobacteriota bacterium]